ncbi:hypothetical protein TIFTF001_009254 [Ficus carica]|uniref:Uncharacterized protein n=1 Tax=Ficus carica TaxID=3494 RepID=A0AA87ZUY6_FICCA|nr:hypothetical protein TIFTF001_009254 [Ficus carica]
MGKVFVNSVDGGCDFNLKIIGYWNAKEDCFANSQSKSTTCSSEESSSSIGSASSSDLLDDDASSSSSSSSSTSPSPETRDQIVSQLPIRKGLSKYYHGKARTFTSLSDVKCVEDLAKKEISFVRRGHRTSFQSPKATISKKNTRGSATSLVSSKSLTRPRSV